MTRASVVPGALTGSCLIGAVVAIGGLTVAGLTEPGDDRTALAAAPLVLMFAVPIGFFVSIIPNLAGTALLAWAGRGNVALRLPVMWALVGAGVGGTTGLAIDGASGALAAIGAASALLCRWKVTWTEDISCKEEDDEHVRRHPARAVARPRPHAADRWLD